MIELVQKNHEVEQKDITELGQRLGRLESLLRQGGCGHVSAKLGPPVTRGTISVPTVEEIAAGNSTYRAILNLNFPVTVEPGHRIMFSFTRFNIEGPTRPSRFEKAVCRNDR